MFDYGGYGCKMLMENYSPIEMKRCEWHIELLVAVNTVQLREKEWILLRQLLSLLGMHLGTSETHSPGAFTI